MYRLENNVEWTEELKNAFKHGIIRAKITYYKVEIREGGIYLIPKTITESNGLKDLELKEVRYVPGVGFIGQATARQLTINLVDNDSNDLENRQLTLYIGADYNGITYYINYGYFTVDAAPEVDSTNNTIKVVAYDNMIKFNKKYENRVTYPCTLKNLLLDICDQSGVALGTTTFANMNFLVEDNQFEGKTLREVLQNIAKCAFSWARIGQDNKLYLDFEVIDDISETITTDDYKINSYKKANKYYGAINKVTYGDSDITGQEKSVTDDNDIALNGIKELVINDNYFAYTQAKRQTLIQAGTRLFGFTYMPVSQLDMVGLIYLDCNDLIEIEDGEGNSVTTRVFSHIIKYNGAISDSITSEGISNNEKTYKNINTEAEKNSIVEISVDRANKKIQSIVTQIGDRSQKTTSITQDVDRIESRVEDIIDYKEEVEGITQILLEEAGEGSLIKLEIKGNATYENYLFPSESLFPSDDIFPNMEGSELI